VHDERFVRQIRNEQIDVRAQRLRWLTTGPTIGNDSMREFFDSIAKLPIAKRHITQNVHNARMCILAANETFSVRLYNASIRVVPAQKEVDELQVQRRHDHAHAVIVDRR